MVVSRLPAGERLRVLEVGAGTGGSTGPVLGALPESRTNYAFTDVSAAFLREAEKRFGGSAATLEYRVLDIERDPGEQGYGLHRYDVVLAAHALYATRDLGESLGHCRQLLAPSGVLVLLEGVERQGWLDLTFGLLPGWWRFEDGHREDYPLVSGSVWRRALVEAGYEKVGVVGVSGSAGGEGAAVVLARAPAEVRAEAGVWVVCPGGAAAEAEAGVVVGELEARGQEVAALEEGADPLRRESWRGLFEGLAASVPLRGVLHLGGLEAPGEDAGTGELAAGVSDLTGSALALLQGLSDAGAHPALGVSFVTRGGQVVGEETGCGVAGSVLWGLGRSAARELGEVRVRLFDVDAGDEGWSGRLAEELLYPDGEGEIAFRGGERRVRRLTRLASGAGEAGDRIRGDRSYLVTGGLGGLGLRVAGWLGERGAGAIVLSGRRGAEGASAEAVAALRSRGFEVRVEIADVTDEAAVRGLVTGLAERGLPPLGGVIHAAGVVSDRALGNQDGESFARVLGPKVLGAWNLHRATLGMELELFVLFSSLAGLIGNAGQSNYAAANAYLDQLASWRRGRGLSGQAIAWGAWSGSGLAEEARERVAGRLAALGGGWLTPEQGLAALDRIVRDDVAESAAALVDWGALGDAAPPLFEDFVSAGDAEARGMSPGDLLDRLRRVDEGEREEVLVSFLREQVQSILRLPAPPPVESGFFELGMDSLTAVELRNRVSRAWGERWSCRPRRRSTIRTRRGLRSTWPASWRGRRCRRAGWRRPWGGGRTTGLRSWGWRADSLGRRIRRRSGVGFRRGRIW